MTITNPHVSPEVEAAARRLQQAATGGVPCAPVRDLIGSDDVAAAYAVQSVIIGDRVAAGATVVGRKIGLTSPAVQQWLGVDTPDFGVLLDDMEYAEDETVPTGRLLQPRAEAEIAFVLGSDLAEGPFTADSVRSAVDHARAAIEIVDSRVIDWDIQLGDTVADNASSGLYVLGAERRTLDEVEPVDVAMVMTCDGTEVSTGNGAACLGDPLNALAWLATAALEYGEPLRAGQVILSGALGPVHPVPPGAVIRADITGLGSVTARFSGKDDA
ncbi:2-keto-4-pentenoate hydratase [Blastococcus tunisiensis]|uniref:2-keto-4-pentenoate hydratase n=1 Tax=Blastococcus tunisiensis TaxID=1798228 RepID=A0A1I2JP00_9ACTN|nr:fumarylacetoacetate hydrolase family protein [Blastococcus sp. DSM 46838]SFF54496.1 2-keto-4-pentenoate hydratase [Blastococcus sp. DSM 46838]